MRVWSMPAWKRLIFYRSAEGGIEVVRVLHSARDFASIIDDEEK